MSYTNFIKAMELAPKCKFYTTAGGKTEEEIRKSEQILNIKFSNQCREFYEGSCNQKVHGRDTLQ